MLNATLKAKLAKAAAVAAAAATGVAAMIGTGPSAGADPVQFNALITMGSDTTQDVLQALSGNSNGLNYTPLQSSTPLATGQPLQVSSWNATALPGQSDNCISPRVGFGVQYRPNGSSEGRRALSRAFDGLASGYGPVSQCGGTKDNSGMINFARSSSGPSSGDVGTDLVYVPFARDALSFAYYRESGAPVTTLTRGELQSLFATGPQTIDGVLIIPCGIQIGSGTFQSWLGMTSSSATENSAVQTCKDIVTDSDISDPDPIRNGRIQEHAGDQLQDKGDAAPAGAQVIVGFSASNFVAQCNGTGLFRLGTTPATVTGVQMGSIDNDGAGNNIGNPVTGTTCPGSTAGNFAPRATFYNNGTFGRNVYNVFPASIIDGFGNTQLKSMFVGAGSRLCSDSVQLQTINNHGFLSPTGCGSTALRGSFLTGIQ